MIACSAFAVLIDRISGIDEEVILRACERHIEHVEVIDPHVGQLIGIGGAIIGLRHLSPKGYRHKIAGFIDLFRHLTPYFGFMSSILPLPQRKRHKQGLRL